MWLHFRSDGENHHGFRRIIGVDCQRANDRTLHRPRVEVRHNRRRSPLRNRLLGRGCYLETGRTADVNALNQQRPTPPIDQQKMASNRLIRRNPPEVHLGSIARDAGIPPPGSLSVSDSRPYEHRHEKPHREQHGDSLNRRRAAVRTGMVLCNLGDAVSGYSPCSESSTQTTVESSMQVDS